MSNRTILMTGGAGFVGHHMVEHFHKNMSYAKIIIMDKLNYSGTLDRLRDINCYPNMNVQVLTADFSLPISDNVKAELKDVTHIIHMGAESHVDKSIENPEPFVISNVVGTMHMLNLARQLDNLETFYYFSTDEVYGACPQGSSPYTELDCHNPGNPYAATKSAGDMLVKAFANTYKISCITTQCMNIFGERQHPEKFIPLCIRKILAGEEITIHASKDLLTSGKRTYIHARNVAAAYSSFIETKIYGRSFPDFYDTYRNFNIVGELEVSNLSVADYIAQILKKPLYYKMVDFHSSRPGHDLRYAMSGEKLKRAGWVPPMTFHESLERTVKWYLDNPKWLEVK